MMMMMMKIRKHKYGERENFRVLFYFFLSAVYEKNTYKNQPK